MNIHGLTQRILPGFVMLLGVTVVLNLNGCVDNNAPETSQDPPEQAVAAATQESPNQPAAAPINDTETSKPLDGAISQNTLLNKPPDTGFTQRTFDPDGERVMKTFATIGLYHLLLTLQPDFELGKTISVAAFREALDRHWVDLGYLMRSSFEFAAELRECLDTNSLVREEIFFMIAGAVEGELAEAYPSILPETGNLLGLPSTPSATGIADAYTHSFLREVSLEGGECKKIASLVETECAIFKAFPEL